MKYLCKIALILLFVGIFFDDSIAVVLKRAPVQLEFSRQIANDFSNVSLASAFRLEQEFAETPQTESKKQISLVKAGIYSALLPGLGEFYVGHKSKARVFFAVEAATWVGFFSFHIYGNWKENDYVNYAAVYANASLENKNDEFRDWVGFYSDIEQFNSLGRVQDPERPYLEDTPENHWRWESTAAQDSYRHLKNRSREAFRRRDFMLGLAIVNRVVSIIDAVRDAKRSQREIKGSEFSIADGLNCRLEIAPFNIEKPISMTIVRQF
jgi:hypothetical protein